MSERQSEDSEINKLGVPIQNTIQNYRKDSSPDNINNIIIIKDNIIKNDMQTIVSNDKIFLEINNNNEHMIFNYNLFLA